MSSGTRTTAAGPQRNIPSGIRQFHPRRGAGLHLAVITKSLLEAALPQHHLHHRWTTPTSGATTKSRSPRSSIFRMSTRRRNSRKSSTRSARWPNIQRFFPYNSQNAIIASGERRPGRPGRKDPARSGQAQERSRGGHHRDGSQFGLFPAAHRGHRLHRPQRPRELHSAHRAAGGHQSTTTRRAPPPAHGHRHTGHHGDRTTPTTTTGTAIPLVQPGPSLHVGFLHHHAERPAAGGLERRQYAGAAVAADCAPWIT